MREVEAQKGLIAEAVVEWSRLSKGQKKFVLVMSLPVSMIVLAVFTLGFILAWYAGQATVDLMFGNQSDGFLTLVYWGIRNALDYWWVAFTPLVTTPAVLGYIEYKSRHPA
jgi:hypothetical protein